MEFVIFFAFVFLFFFFLILKGIRDDRRRRENFTRRRLEHYGEAPERQIKPEEAPGIARYYERHRTGFYVDDITWNDLDMDQLFRQMDYCHSAAGEEYLYASLRLPAMSGEDFTKREEKIRYFMEHGQERAKLQTAFWQMGRMGKYSLYDYLEFLDGLGERSNRKHYAAIACLVGSVALCFGSFSAGFVCLMLVIGYNIATYMKEKGDIEPYISSFAYIFRILKHMETLYQIPVPVLKEEQAELKQLKSVFGRMKRGSFWAMSSSGGGNPAEILLDYLRMLLHLDVIKFNDMLHEVRLHVDEIDRIMTLIGQIETYLAIGEYRTHLEKTKGFYCVPQFQEAGENRLEIKTLYHPLLEKPVCNDIAVEKGVLLTGSNASGKSTFLKSVALCALLSQTIQTCPAAGYKAPYYRIISSMSLRDDLEGGDSYYIVEIKALKRIMDAAAKEGAPVLCFVDEVLRGTNTVERIAASTEILHSLSREQTGGRALCFAATHDIELTSLLETEYDNYHFEEEVRDNDVYFAYKLLSGKASTRNAISLLAVMGYDESIISRARKRAETFVRQGKWIS